MYKEVAEGFNFKTNDKGIVAQRVFYGTSNSEDNGFDISDIPMVGDSFFDDSTNEAVSDMQSELQLTENAINIICRDVEWIFVNWDSTKVKIVASYSNEVIDKGQFTQGSSPGFDATTLPQQLELSGEFQTWNPNMNGQGAGDSPWVWEGTEDKIQEPIPFRIDVSTLTIERVILQNNIADYMTVIRDCKFCVNNGEIESGPLTGKKGSWLFIGAKTEPFGNMFDEVAYRISLTFQQRAIRGEEEMSWQKILNKKGEWAVPYNGDRENDPYIYPMVSLDKLLSE